MQRVQVLTAWSDAAFRAMGTTAQLVVQGGPPGLATWAQSEIERLEHLWSRFRVDTDVARLNGAGGAPVVVSQETIGLVERAIAAWRETDGRFDPTVLRALEANGYDESFELVRARGEEEHSLVATSAPPGLTPLAVRILHARGAASPAPAPGCAGIRIDRHTRTVTLPANVTLDFGGIGKGYAADLVATGVMDRGAAGACIAIGGDVRCIGEGPVDGAWSIDVEDVFDEDRVLFTCMIGDGAVVTSTSRFRRWRHGRGWRHHLIDPATGRPSWRGIAAVVVAGSEAWRAETLAKAAFVAGPSTGAGVLERAGVLGWIIGVDGNVIAADGARVVEMVA